MVYLDLPPAPRDDLEKAYLGCMPLYEEVVESLARTIRSELFQKRLSVTIKHRVKEFSSWYAKVLRVAASKDNNRSSIAVTDVLGIRVVCPFLEEVEQVSDILKQLFNIDEFEVKGADYPIYHFGYESVHFLISIPAEYVKNKNLPEDFIKEPVCEIQVRSILQEAWAEVEHELIYKSDFSPLDEPLKRKLAAINANLTLSDIMFQEIRDYQKDLHTALKQRRRDFYNRIRGESTFTVVGGSRKHEDKTHHPVLKDTVDNLLLKGLLAHNKGNFSEAVEIYSEILSRDIREDIRSIILTHRGMAYFSDNMFSPALEDFNRALELDPHYTRARYYRAIHARTRGRYEEACTDLDECIRIEPYNPEFLTARAETHAAAGDIEAAMLDCKSVLRIDPNFKPALRLLKELKEP